MSAPSVEARVQALEQALALPTETNATTASSAQLDEAKARIAQLEKQLARANYRLAHLSQGFDTQRARAETAEKELAKIKAQQ